MIVSAPAPRINFPLIDSAEYRLDSSSLSRPTSLLAGAKGLKADIEIPPQRPKAFFVLQVLYEKSTSWQNRRR